MINWGDESPYDSFELSGQDLLLKVRTCWLIGMSITETVKACNLKPTDGTNVCRNLFMIWEKQAISVAIPAFNIK